MRTSFKQELAKLKPMTPSEKREYIWEYYKLHIGLVGILLFLVGSLLNTWVFNPPKQDYLYIAWVSQHVPGDQLSALSQALSVLVSDPGRERVTVTSYVHGPNPEMNMAMTLRRSSMIATQGIDLFIGTAEDFLEDHALGWLATLKTMPVPTKPHETDRLYSPEGTVIGLPLANTALLTEIGIPAEELYVGIVSNTQRNHRAYRALALILHRDE